MKVRHPYFLTRCDHGDCDWQGSSEECGLISYGDDADTTCPKCGRIFLCDEVEDGIPEIED